MNRAWIELWKGLWKGAPLLLLLTACPRLDPMWTQPKVKAYRASPYYPDALAMRAPPAGTVPYRPPIDPAVATGLTPDGRPLPTMPVAVTPELLARGRRGFEVYCAACHGVLGDGQSQVALNFSLRKPANLHDYRGTPDGHIFEVVTLGFGFMPSYANQLSIEDRWAVVAYVRALQLSQHATLDQVPPDARERLEQERR
jgi:mono/diheme cytochrome c family protein